MTCSKGFILCISLQNRGAKSQKMEFFVFFSPYTVIDLYPKHPTASPNSSSSVACIFMMLLLTNMPYAGNKWTKAKEHFSFFFHMFLGKVSPSLTHTQRVFTHKKRTNRCDTKLLIPWLRGFSQLCLIYLDLGEETFTWREVPSCFNFFRWPRYTTHTPNEIKSILHQKESKLR